MMVWSLFRTALVLTGYITMILSVTRTISLIVPFYKIKKVAVYVSIVVFGACRLAAELVYRYYRSVSTFM